MSEPSARIERRIRERASRDARPTGAGHDPAGGPAEWEGHAGAPARGPIAARPMALGRGAGARSSNGNDRRLGGGSSVVPAVDARDLALWFG